MGMGVNPLTQNPRNLESWSLAYVLMETYWRGFFPLHSFCVRAAINNLHISDFCVERKTATIMKT
jgi:hypothetical protein